MTLRLRPVSCVAECLEVSFAVSLRVIRRKKNHEVYAPRSSWRALILHLGIADWTMCFSVPRRGSSSSEGPLHCFSWVYQGVMGASVLRRARLESFPLQLTLPEGLKRSKVALLGDSMTRSRSRCKRRVSSLHSLFIICRPARSASLLRRLGRNLDGLVHSTDDVHPASLPVRREHDERVGRVPLGEDVALVRCGEDGVGVAGLEAQAEYG